MPRPARRASAGRFLAAHRAPATAPRRRLRRVQRRPPRTALPPGAAPAAVLRDRPVRTGPDPGQPRRGLPAAARHRAVRHHPWRRQRAFPQQRRGDPVAAGDRRGESARRRGGAGPDRSRRRPLGVAPEPALPGRVPLGRTVDRAPAHPPGGFADGLRDPLRPARRAYRAGHGGGARHAAGGAPRTAGDRRLRRRRGTAAGGRRRTSGPAPARRVLRLPRQVPLLRPATVRRARRRTDALPVPGLRSRTDGTPAFAGGRLPARLRAGDQPLSADLGAAAPGRHPQRVPPGRRQSPREQRGNP
ncbi:Uncharacterised protein [Acinetobacter baumannii]|nr:Uncharacterised protein [Acinetobacter baumannii]